MPTHELPFFLTDASTDTGNRDEQIQIHNREVNMKGTQSYLPRGLVREWAVSCHKLTNACTQFQLPVLRAVSSMHCKVAL